MGVENDFSPEEEAHIMKKRDKFMKSNKYKKMRYDNIYYNSAALEYYTAN